MCNIYKVICLLGLNSELKNIHYKQLITKAKQVIKNAYKNGFVKICIKEKNTYLVGVAKNWKDLIEVADSLY